MFLWARTGPDAWETHAESSLRGLPVLFGCPPSQVHAWRSASGSVAVRWIADPWDVGGDVVRARTAEDHAVFVLGRPILWTSDSEARGLDARSIAVTPEGVSVCGVPIDEAILDGRFCVVVARDDELFVVTDPLGQVPVYHRSSGRSRVVSNVASVISREDDASSSRAAADFLLTGHSPRRLPLNASLSTVPADSRARFWRDGGCDVVSREVSVADLRGTPDPGASASALRAAVCAMIELGSREPVVQLTGGFDSRIVLAAARHVVADDLSAVTLSFEGEAGYPYTSDVELSRVLAELAQVTHHVDFLSVLDLPQMEHLLALAGLLGPGTVSPQELRALLVAPSPGSVFLNGVGGELGRDAFRLLKDGPASRGDHTGLSAELIRIVVPDPHRSLVGPEHLADLRDWFEEGVARDTDAGFLPREVVGKLILGYAGSWHGSKAGMFDVGHEAHSPLLARPLWRHFVSQPDADRRSARLQRLMVQTLDPRLDEVPYGSRSMVYSSAAERARDRPWITHRRRVDSALTGFSGRGLASLETLQRRIRDQTESKRTLVEDLLDDRRLKTLLTMEVGRADYEDRSQLWRLWALLSG